MCRQKLASEKEKGDGGIKVFQENPPHDDSTNQEQGASLTTYTGKPLRQYNQII